MWVAGGLDGPAVHLDDEFAAGTPYGRCIVHGVLLNRSVTHVCGTLL